ncbi:hypothetical protein BN1263390086 [Stenotrophomonas maltophilia]|nr:hypothetical protein BN1263390086 [Stenotrophomonas maltophilia]
MKEVPRHTPTGSHFNALASANDCSTPAHEGDGTRSTQESLCNPISAKYIYPHSGVDARNTTIAKPNQRPEEKWDS